MARYICLAFFGLIGIVKCSSTSSSSSLLMSQVGDKCDNSSQHVNHCDSTIGLQCTSGRCQCAKGYTISRNGSKCLEIAHGLNSSCVESIQCWKSIGRLSQCIGGSCSCYDSETLPIVFHQGRCYYGESLGDYCQIEGLCNVTTPNAYCHNKICSCVDGWIPSWDQKICLKIASGIDDECIENSQCEQSQLGALSECDQESMKCKCYQIPMLPTIFHDGRCLFGGDINDICEVNLQCEAKNNGSICLNGKCSYENGIDSPCINHAQCIKSLGYFSRCNHEKRCECIIPSLSSNSSNQKSEIKTKFAGSKCYSLKHLGEPCLFSRQCSAQTQYSICSDNGICECTSGSHVSNLDGFECLEIANEGLDSPCEIDVQCQHGPLGSLAICNERLRRCGCSNANNVLYYNGKCVVHRQLGENCQSHDECKSGSNLYAECSEAGVCQCIFDGFKRVSNQTCLPLSKSKTLESFSSSSSSSISLSTTNSHNFCIFNFIPLLFSVSYKLLANT